MDKYFIIYKTVNLLNSRFYIGMHETCNPDDSYLGSGKRLRAEIKKYGRENFRKTILHVLSTKAEMKQRESEIVNEMLLRDPLCLNLKKGGEGGWDFVNASGRNIRNDFERDAAYCEKVSRSRKGVKPNLSEDARQNLSTNNPMKREDSRAKVSAALKDKPKSEEHKAKIAAKITEWHRARKQSVHGV